MCSYVLTATRLFEVGADDEVVVGEDDPNGRCSWLDVGVVLPFPDGSDVTTGSITAPSDVGMGNPEIMQRIL